MFTERSPCEARYLEIENQYSKQSAFRFFIVLFVMLSQRYLKFVSGLVNGPFDDCAIDRLSKLNFDDESKNILNNT